MDSLAGFNKFGHNSSIIIQVSFWLERLKAMKGRRRKKSSHSKYKIVNRKEHGGAHEHIEREKLAQQTKRSGFQSRFIELKNW